MSQRANNTKNFGRWLTVVKLCVNSTKGSAGRYEAPFFMNNLNTEKGFSNIFLYSFVNDMLA